MLWLLPAAEISRAGINIVSVVAQKLMPHPWDYLAVVAVMMSTIGTLETSILQFSRTLFSMSRDSAVHPRYGRLHPVNSHSLVSPRSLITGRGLALLFASYLAGIKTVVNDSINAVGFQIAFYYGLTGLACAWYFRAEALVLLCHFLIHRSPLLPQTAGTSGQRGDEPDGELTADGSNRTRHMPLGPHRQPPAAGSLRVAQVVRSAYG